MEKVLTINNVCFMIFQDLSKSYVTSNQEISKWDIRFT